MTHLLIPGTDSLQEDDYQGQFCSRHPADQLVTMHVDGYVTFTCEECLLEELGNEEAQFAELNTACVAEPPGKVLEDNMEGDEDVEDEELTAEGIICGAGRERFG